MWCAPESNKQQKTTLTNTMLCMQSQLRYSLVAVIIGLSAAAFPAQGAWVAQGPGPIIDGQDEGIPGPNPVAGAITSVAVDPANPSVIYVGAVNGGVWKTTDGTDASPVWTPLADNFPGMSINAIALSPLNSQVVFAGTGSTSSYAFDGSPGFGVARSMDGGATWSFLASATFNNRVINSVVPTKLSSGNVVLASTLFDGGGVYRSTDDGATFTRISGGSGLPDAGVSSLVADAGDQNRFYAAVPSAFINVGGSSLAGVYKSIDGGVTWAQVNTGLTGQGNSDRILLGVSAAAGNSVYAAIISHSSDTLSGVFQSQNNGATWMSMGVPSPSIFPGGQGLLHGAIVADPSDPNVVFISGDRQNGSFPNVNGANNFSGNVFRGIASPAGTTWQNVVDNGNGGGANNTAPHADSRAMVFDSNGNILQGNDGGIFRLVSPDSAGNRVWVSVNGNITPTEAHSAAYDPLAKVVFSGNQDTGTSMQSAPGSFQWFDFLQGDGGIVAVDADQVAHPNESIRYIGFTGLALARTFWDAANNFITDQIIPYNIVSGSGAGTTIQNFDPNIQFFNPYVLNAIDKTRMLIGTANIYESFNRGDSVNNLTGSPGALGAFIGDGFGNSPLAYGGSLNGVANPGVFYVGAGAKIVHRAGDGNSIMTLASYPGVTVRALVLDPQNWRHLFVVDTASKVWATMNEGTSWTELTANLPALCPSVRTIQIFSPSASPINTVLIAGGHGGVFQMRRPGAAGTSWTALSTGLPHALFYDLHYDYTDNVLVAGSLGRGVWTLTHFFRGGGGTGMLDRTDAAPGTFGRAPNKGNTSSMILNIPQPPPVAAIE